MGLLRVARGGPERSWADAGGMRGVHAGPLVNSVVAEALTSILIGINRRYKVPGAGISITGLSGETTGPR